MLNLEKLKKYYKNKKVLITGHTGFKGSYMCVLLKMLGAKTYGYALRPEKGSLYTLIEKGYRESSKSKNAKIVDEEIFADIRNQKKLTAFVKKVKPDYVLHMAAQPLVLLGYEEPQYTYDVNVMGTVNLMDAIRLTYSELHEHAGTVTRRGGYHPPVRKGELCEPISILNVTTDKVYENNDLSNYAFKEVDKLCGRDPYANSKSCSELVTYAYNKSFFNDKNIFRVSTARAGNVIGGGDLNKDRIIPDCYRAIKLKKDMFVRSPESVRPYQFVLEPLILYLNILALQKENVKYEGSYNIGPDKKACLTTKELVKKFFDAYEAVCVNQDTSSEAKNKKLKNNVCYMPKVVYNNIKKTTTKHEAAFLRLDNNLIKKTFNYKEIFDMKKTMTYTASIYKCMLDGRNIYESINTIIL